GAIPERFEKGVGETEVEDVLHRLLAEEVVDAKDARLGKVPMQDLVERARRREIAAERLLDHDAGAGGALLTGQSLDDGGEEAGRDGQVVQRPPNAFELIAQRPESRRVAVVAVDVAQQR